MPSEFTTMNKRRVEAMEAENERIFTAFATGATWEVICGYCSEAFSTIRPPEERKPSDAYCVNCLCFATGPKKGEMYIMAQSDIQCFNCGRWFPTIMRMEDHQSLCYRYRKVRTIITVSDSSYPR